MTAEEIDNLPVESLEYLAEMLTPDELDEWANEGYSGEAYIRIKSK